MNFDGQDDYINLANNIVLVLIHSQLWHGYIYNLFQNNIINSQENSWCLYVRENEIVLTINCGMIFSKMGRFDYLFNENQWS